MIESKDDENSESPTSPPPLSKLSLKGQQKTLTLLLTPTVKTSPATPAREHAEKSPASTKMSPIKSPQLPIKLATLSKPTSQSFLAAAFNRNRNARHSIDVRALPSYLAKKRQSTFGQFLTVLNPSAPDASESSDEPLFEEPVAPTLSLGERVAWVQTKGPEFGQVRWIGRMPQVTNDWTVGVEFDNCIGTGDGTFEGRRYFVAKENFAKFLPLSTLTKVDNYAGRPRSGTMLSRMSVQLKPGQLISIQRSPSVNIQHCSLNAPHHVGHDVHETNDKHCQCPSCNHPCAHLCKTRRPKGRKHEMAHMCHFSSKPHNKMCCGGEDLPCATKPLTQPGTSWMHTTDMASLRTVPTEPIPRRKSVTIHDNRNAVSAPTSIERKPTASPLDSTLKERRGSDLSISSLPSSGSPAEVYIARGVLTDESDVDSDTSRSNSSNVFSRNSGLLSFVSCFTTNSSSLRSKKKLKEKRKRKLRKMKKRNKMSPNERRHRRGLSSDTSYDCETTHNSHNQTSSLVSGVSSSKTRTNPSPVQHKSTSISPPLAHSPIRLSDGNHSTTVDPNVIPEERQSNFDDDHISEGNEGQDGCTSSSKSSGHFITTKADIESTVNYRSPSSHSTTSDCMSPRRRKKGPAPAPPPTASTSPTSLNLSVSSTSLPQSPTNTSTPTSVSKRRTSYKKNPAPTPPNLTRSMSEQKQLNLKNLINAVPSFRSEVDLQGVSRRSSPFGDSVENGETSIESKTRLDNDDKVPNHRTHSRKVVSKSDASTQVTFESDYYEICQFSNVKCYASPVSNSQTRNAKPELPKKTFDAISLFGCEINNKLKDNHHSTHMVKSHSMPFNQRQITRVKSANAAECDRYSSDLNAILSPKHKIGKIKTEGLLRGVSDGSMASTATVIEFINALTDLETEIKLTDAEHESQSPKKKNNSKTGFSSETNSDENITVKSMPTKWRYSSSSIDSLSSKSSKMSETSLLNSYPRDKPEKQNFKRFTNKSWSDGTGYEGIHSSASEQSLSSLSSSSTLSVASTIRSSSSTPTPWNQNSLNPQKDMSESNAGKPPKYPTPRPRSKNSYPNINTGNISQTSAVECTSNPNNMFHTPGQSKNNGQTNGNALWSEQSRVTKIMEQLEVAISHGQHRKAAVLARELAFRKVTCTLNRSTVPNTNSMAPPIIAYLYIEDRISHKGPIPLQLYPSMSVDMLKLKVEKEFNIPSEMQKWILGKTLATNSSASLATYGITASGCPIFLYLLTEESDDFIDLDELYNQEMQPLDESILNLNQQLYQNPEHNPNIEHFPNEENYPIPEKYPEVYPNQRLDLNNQLEPVKQDSESASHSNSYNNVTQVLNLNDIEIVEKEKPRTYLELVELDDVNCVTNTHVFECPVCFLEIQVGDGVVLRDCLHAFCKFCLSSAVEYNEEVQVKCPFRNDEYSCENRMQDREVKQVVPIELYERYLHKSVSTAESKAEKSFHCKTVDCRGWCEFDDNVNLFHCPVCGHENCLNCQAIHEKVNCKQYQDELEFQAAQNEDAKKTKEFVDNMLKTGEALRCPQCQVVLMKKWGCDWVKCSMCETEICWVTKGMRWGPKGRGDTSGGCKCMFNGQRCHPKCKYCH